MLRSGKDSDVMHAKASAHDQQRQYAPEGSGYEDQRMVSPLSVELTVVSFDVLEYASARCKEKVCGVSRGIMSRKSTMRWNALEWTRMEQGRQPMSMPYSSSSFRL
jgi:hypothetical protein